MFIIVGLGNPGVLYEKSRHNAGFQAIDVLSKRLGVTKFKLDMEGLIGEGRVGTEKVLLVKPQTYMNLSGNCVQKIAHFYKVEPKNVVVLYDDIDLPVGSLRIRANGSAGTHNGMRSVVACLNSQGFPRVRIGVGASGDTELKDFVLGKPSKADQELLEKSFENAADAAERIVRGELDKAQMLYNKKHEGK
ncbi:MAG: aminoacyl-tRNA hydrolase [Clostridia bacterium]|nr:aminoacyl-tRNA hydrolase [Clostridia bacterium]